VEFRRRREQGEKDLDAVAAKEDKVINQDALDKEVQEVQKKENYWQEIKR